MVHQQLSLQEAGMLANYRTSNAQYWNYQARHGVKKWLKQVHAIENFWVGETMRRKRKPLDVAVANAVRRRFCEARNADPDIRGIVFMVMMEIWQTPGLVHLIKFRNGWTDRPYPLRDPARKNQSAARRRALH